MATESWTHSPGSITFPREDGPPFILSPLTKTSRYRYTQSQVPVFDTCQVFVNLSLGLNTVPAGTVTSLIRARLLHPYPNVDGFGVGVYWVPVGVGEPRMATGVKKATVDVGNEGNVIAGNSVFVGNIVGDGVSVAGGTKAVWVWKMEAAMVPTPAVKTASTSDIGVAVVSCPPQETSNIPTSNTIKDFFRKYIFTSI
jgi:hypothetical protein